VVPSVLIGLGLLALGAAAWTGAWRRWAAWDGPPAYNAPITVVPGLGLMCVAAGLDYGGHGWAPLNALGGIGLVGGLVLYLWRPRWWGPRWYRQRRERGEVRLDLALSANVLAGTIEGERARQDRRWWRWGRSRVAGWWRARLLLEDGELRGTLVLYRTALAFAALDGPNEILVVRDHELRGAHAEDGTLVVTAAGGELRFRMRGAGRAARRVARTLTP
jgi:hypothetical protein